MNRQKVLDVLNSLEVIERQGGDEPYILVELNEMNREKLVSVGIDPKICEKYGDNESFCVLAFAFMEGYANDFQNGKLVLDISDENLVFSMVKDELKKVTDKFGKFNSVHKGYAVILEELDEAWKAIKENDINHARKEMVQVAASAIRFVLDT